MVTRIKLSPDEVCEIIENWAKDQFGKESSVSIDLENVYVGYGCGEHMETQFTGITIEI